MLEEQRAQLRTESAWTEVVIVKYCSLIRSDLISDERVCMLTLTSYFNFCKIGMCKRMLSHLFTLRPADFRQSIRVTWLQPIENTISIAKENHSADAWPQWLTGAQSLLELARLGTAAVQVMRIGAPPRLEIENLLPSACLAFTIAGYRSTTDQQCKNCHRTDKIDCAADHGDSWHSKWGCNDTHS